MSELEYWIWFSKLRHLRFRTRRALLERFGSAREIWFSEKREVEKLEGILPEEVSELLSRDPAEADRIVRRCGEEDVQILTFQDAAYPKRLQGIPDPPYVLYVKGRLPAVDAEAVIGVVGTRRSTPYGDKMARDIAYEIAAKGGMVTTGLAGGIDSRAAEGALMAGGTVIGVLGVAINEVYPSYNERLYADVQATGALVSEYPPDARGSRDWFPQRNRIIAGLSVGVAVPEAPVRSGALITAHRALDYGRDVFAVPHNADAPNGRGGNNLLREGAILAENGWDILKEYEARFPDRIFREGKSSIPEELAVPEETRAAEAEAKSGKAEKPEKVPKTGKGFLKFRIPNRTKAETAPRQVLESQLGQLSENQLKIIGVMDRASMHVDDIIDLCMLPASVVLSELTMLQIKGFVQQEQGKRFTLNMNK